MEELDYKSMKILPVSILLVLLILPLFNIGMLAVMLVSSGSGMQKIALQGSLGTVYFICESVSMAAVIITLVCLYRMSGILRSYRLAWSVFVLEMMSELLRQIVGMFARRNGSSLFMLASSAVDQLPKVCVMIGITALLGGLIEMSEHMNDSDQKAVSGCEGLPAAHIRNLQKTWLVTESLRIILWFALYAGMFRMVWKGGEVSAAGSGVMRLIVLLSMLMGLIHIIVSVMIFWDTRREFRSYYIYRYNGGTWVS